MNICYVKLVYTLHAARFDKNSLIITLHFYCENVNTETEIL